jgi:predicted amidohydrolase
VLASVALLLPFRAVAAEPRPQAEPGTVRVAGIVLKWVRADKDANYRRAETLIRQAAAHGAQIVCTTECFLDGYAIADKSIPLDKYRSLGEPVPQGDYCRKLSAQARELKILLIAGMLEADGDARYNTAVLIGPDGRLLGEYRKYIVFVHPAEFLVTGPDGAILQRTIVGDRLVISPAEVGSAADSSGVFYFDVPRTPRPAR